MSGLVKKYPRARVSRHPRINGWVIDLIQRDGARPRRVAATYVTAEFAARAALAKLGHTPTTPAAPRPSMFTQPGERPPVRNFEVFERPAPKESAEPSKRSPRGARATGTCTPCGRPMRPAGSKSADYPGTTLRQRDGICQTCYQKAKREGAAS